MAILDSMSPVFNIPVERDTLRLAHKNITEAYARYWTQLSGSSLQTAVNLDSLMTIRHIRNCVTEISPFSKPKPFHELMKNT